MKKLSLKPEDLTVLSFQTAPAPRGAGTVHGAAAPKTLDPSCQWSDCWTCGVWCPETTNPEVTGPCNCPEDTKAPVC